MLWVLLIAITADTYAVGGLYSTKEECTAQLEVEFDKCWPAKLQLQVPEGETIYIIKNSYDY